MPFPGNSFWARRKKRVVASEGEFPRQFQGLLPESLGPRTKFRSPSSSPGSIVSHCRSVLIFGKRVNRPPACRVSKGAQWQIPKSGFDPKPIRDNNLSLKFRRIRNVRDAKLLPRFARRGFNPPIRDFGFAFNFAASNSGKRCVGNQFSRAALCSFHKMRSATLEASICLSCVTTSLLRCAPVVAAAPNSVRE